MGQYPNKFKCFSTKKCKKIDFFAKYLCLGDETAQHHIEIFLSEVLSGPKIKGKQGALIR
jgi:hypothetical protein